MNAIIKLIIPVFGVIGGVLFLFTLSDFPDKVCVKCWPVEMFLYFTYLLFALTLVATLFGTYSGITSNPGSLKGSAIGVGLMVLIAAISYGLASDEVFAYYGDVSATTVKLTDMGLYMLYFLMAGTIGAILFSAVNSIIKR